MCAESFGKTGAIGPSYSVPCLPFSSYRPVKNIFRCACGRGRQRLLLRKGGLHMQIVYRTISALLSEVARIDTYR
jgi:hypothetical protein